MKLATWPGFKLPDLGSVAVGARVGATVAVDLDAIYYDTPDLRLARRGITLRHRRTGTGPGVWTVKFPSEDRHHGGDTGELVRAEIDVDGPFGEVPAPARALVAARVRTAPFEPVAHIRTRRCRTPIHDEVGTPWAEVADDEVSVMEGERVVMLFREVEVEVTAEAPAELLAALAARLEAAGAGPRDRTPKLVRVLGPRALAAPELAEEDDEPPSPDAPAAVAVRTALAASVRRMIEHHHVVVLDDDPEGVHQLRVGTRRLRSDLSTFGPLLETDRTDRHRDELKWLGGALGAVRDADVLLARLAERSEGLADDVDRRAAEVLLERLRDERAGALAALVDVLASRRYLELLDELVAMAEDPPTTGEAHRRAGKVLPRLAAKPWRSLARVVDGLPDDPPAEALHDVRKRAKRARYAAEAVAPVVGDDARTAAKRLAAVQEVLGDHQDAMIATEWLRSTAGPGPAEGVAAGLLIAGELVTAIEHRRSWEDAWAQASHPKRWAWLP